MIKLTLITPPADLPVTVDEVLAQLKSPPDEDALILGYIRVATARAETVLNRSLINRTYDLTLDRWQDAIEVPLPPLSSVTSIKYDDTDNVEQTVATTIYEVDTSGHPGIIKRISGQSWPDLVDTDTKSLSRIRVRFVSGYGENPTDIPDEIRHAVTLISCHFFWNRENVMVGRTVNEIPGTANDLLHSYRFRSFQ